MPNYESLLSDAISLPINDRIQLIEAIWDTLPEDALPRLSDEWAAEINRRSKEFDTGLIEPTPWEQIRAEAFHRVKN